MLPDAVPVPASLMTLLAVFSPLFTAPSFRTFTALACGFLAQSGKRTVCGMLVGAGLSRAWSHDRAHYFFSRARSSPVPAGTPMTWESARRSRYRAGNSAHVSTPHLEHL